MGDAENGKRVERSSSERQVPVTVVASLLSALAAGGTGSAATSWSLGGQMREGQVRLEGSLQALRDEVRRQGEDSRAATLRLDARVDGLAASARASQESLDARLRAVELRLERLDPRPPR